VIHHPRREAAPNGLRLPMNFSGHDARCCTLLSAFHFIRREETTKVAYNQSGWGTVPPNASIPVTYIINGGQDFGAQFAQGKPEGALLDGSSDGRLVSYNHEIGLNVDTGLIFYQFQLLNLTDNLQSFMLCGGGLV
jgi:hypothetical protein